LLKNSNTNFIIKKMKKIKLILALSMVLICTMLLSNCQNNDFEELVQEEQLLGKEKSDRFIYYKG